jgi:hypothetical protein
MMRAGMRGSENGEGLAMLGSERSTTYCFCCVGINEMFG